jgi:hypothetical protein
MQKLKDFSRIIIIALVIGLSVGYVLAGWSPPGGPPTNWNAETPINVGSNPSLQTKTGNLFINNDLTARQFFVAGGLTSPLPKVGIGPLAGSARDATNPAILDIDGQIRIRGGNPGLNKFLKSDDSGLASWAPLNPAMAKLTEGFGIDLGDYTGPLDANGDPTLTFEPTEITTTGKISVWTGLGNIPTNRDDVDPNIEAIQRRITGTASPIQAITAVTTSGAATFSNFVTTAQAGSGSGLTLTNTTSGLTTTSATSGPISLAVNVGPATGNTSGLSTTTGNIVKLNVDTAGTGDGLRIDATDNTVKFETCTDGYTWKYVSGAWTCSAFPTSSISMPGESVMYLRVKSPTTAPSCPSGWSGITSVESAGATNTNNVQVCYRSDKGCQVIYLRAYPSSPVSCPASWTPEAASSSEWAPGGSSTNNVRTCYICN